MTTYYNVFVYDKKLGYEIPVTVYQKEGETK